MLARHLGRSVRQHALLRTVPAATPRVLRPAPQLTGAARLLTNGPRRRHQRQLPVNTGIMFTPQQEAWVVERFGRFHAVLEPGLNFLVPIVDRVKYVHSLKEIVVEIPSQAAITQDNVTLHLDAVLYLKVTDPYKASYGVEDAEYAMAQLAQTTMRSELGQMALDTIFRERAALNISIVEAINHAATPWGMSCLRCEIRDIMLPDKVVEDMQRQVSAERKKRAAILESEGNRAAAVNIAEGRKTAAILASEAIRMEQVNKARGEADAIRARAEAQAEAIDRISEAINREGGSDAVALRVASEYLEAFGKLAKEGNTMLLPANTSDPASMVAQAMAIYNQVKTPNGAAKPPKPARSSPSSSTSTTSSSSSNKGLDTGTLSALSGASPAPSSTHSSSPSSPAPGAAVREPRTGAPSYLRFTQPQ